MDSLISNDEVIVGRKGKLELANLHIMDQTVSESDEIPVDPHHSDAEIRTVEYFKEKEFVLRTIHESVCIFDREGNDCLVSVRKMLKGVTEILEKYREEPQLLDPHVVEILGPVFDKVLLPVMREKREWTTLCSLLSSLVYTVSSVCGQDSVVANAVFPHRVDWLEPVLTRLTDMHAEQWEPRYVMLLWLSVLVMVPFDEAALGIESLSARILEIAKVGLDATASNCNKAIVKASSLLVARLFSRTDASSRAVLSRFLASMFQASDSESVPYLEALTKTLTVIPSNVLSQDVLSSTFEKIQSISAPTSRSRKLIISTSASLAVLGSSNLEHVEACVERIFAFVSDKDSSVRFCVAKNLSRITASLPPEYAEQIVEYVIGLRPDTDLEVHARCLILGELARRCLVRRDVEIHAVVSAAMDALEKERSSQSLTVQVRDSGCAIIWSLSRSVDPNFLLPFVLNRCLASLIVAALFERDINLRRVAAASIQELIGRVGTIRFPLGFAILNSIDFWTVANIEDCFVTLPSQILEAVTDKTWYDDIYERFMNHLLDEKLERLAIQIGQQVSKNGLSTLKLASDALAKLLWLRPQNPDLIDRIAARATTTESTDWARRLGSVWFLKFFLRTSSTRLSDTTQSVIRNLVPQIEKKRLYRGKGGDMMRIACYELVGEIFNAFGNNKIFFKEELKFVTRICSETLLEGILHLNDQVQISAVLALRQVVLNSTIPVNQVVGPVLIDGFVSRLRSGDVNISARRGMVLALSILIEYLDSPNQLSEVADILQSEVKGWPTHHISFDMIDPLCRKYALFGLVRIAMWTTDEYFSSSAVDALVIAMEDFQTDKRGDVGSWVRLSAIKGIEIMTRFTADPVVRQKLIRSLIAHAGERLDRIREAAVGALIDLSGPCFDASQELLKFFAHITEYKGDPLDLRYGIRRKLETFSYDFSTFRICPFRGICEVIADSTLPDTAFLLSHYVQCTGGLTAHSTSNSAASALVNACIKSGEKVIEGIFEIMKGDFPNSRVTSDPERISRFFIPAVNTLSVMISRDPALLTLSQIRKVHAEFITENFTNSNCPPLLHMNRMRAVCGLYSRFALEDQKFLQFMIVHGLSAPTPVLRHAVAMDLLTSVTCHSEADELVDSLDSTNWVSEDVSDWMPAVERLAASAGLDSYQLERVATVIPKRREPEYANFVNDVHRFR